MLILMLRLRLLPMETHNERKKMVGSTHKRFLFPPIFFVSFFLPAGGSEASLSI